MFKKKEEKTKAKPKVHEEMSKGEWMQKYWRPCAAFMYMICCLADFAIFPIMFTVVQFWETQAANDAFRQWIPITLQGGGLFHVSMCAVLGVSAYGRTQEKLNGTAGQPAQPMGMASPTIGGTPPAMGGGFGAPAQGGFGGTNNAGFNTPQSGASTFGVPQAGGFGAAAGGFGAPAATGGFGNPTPGATAFGTTDPNAGFGAQTIATTASGKKIVPDFDQPLL